MTAVVFEFASLAQEATYRYFDLPETVDPPSELRDPALYPYASDWYGNTAIGSGASFTSAGAVFTKEVGTQGRIKTDGINIFVYKTDPLKTITKSTFYYTQAGDQVNASGGSAIPTGTKIYVPPTAGGDGKMNEILAALTSDGKLIEGQPLLLDQTQPSTNPLSNPRIPFVPVVDGDITTYPVSGGHGGSHMTAFGLTIRAHEFNDISKPLRHALAVNLPPRMIAKVSATNTTGYRAPAIDADGNWDVVGSNNYYEGTVPALKLGALLTWAPGFDISSITDPYMAWLAQGIMDYGMYVVDATGTADVIQFSVEKTIEADWNALPIEGSNQLWALFPSLQVVNNNQAGQWGGGGTPRVPTLPGLKGGGTVVTPGELIVTLNDVVRSMFNDGVLPAEPAGSIFVKHENAHEPAIIRDGFDWKTGSALHADARPNPATGLAWHGAPWDWTTPADGLVTDYQFFNIWHEAAPYVFSGLPKGVRIQWRNIEAWVLNSAKTAWTKVLGPGAATGYQTSSGRPTGGYFRTTPNYQINTISTGVTAQIEGWSGSTAPKWRTESAGNGGGWSMSFDPMTTSAGAVIDNMAILHGPFQGTVSPNRIAIPTGGHIAYSGQARLIMDDYSAVPASAKFHARLGSDIFRAKTSAQDPPSARSTSLCNPRMLDLTSDWRWFGHCSGSAAMIRSYPALPFVNG